MLKFKSQKRTYLPKYSIIIWLLTLVAIIYSMYFPSWQNINDTLAINPAQISQNIQNSAWQILKLLSAVFLHGSWQHWLGNMIIFLIIALPIEKKLGGFWFLLIYFASGFVANISGIIELKGSQHYLLGASGAVSGLLGAWLILFPKHKVKIILPIGLYMQKAEVPLFLFGLLWLIIQLILQVSSLKDHSVVWVAHIVGFITGFFMAWLYRTMSK